MGGFMAYNDAGGQGRNEIIPASPQNTQKRKNMKIVIDANRVFTDDNAIRSMASSIESWRALMGLEQAFSLQRVRFPQENAPFAGLSATLQNQEIA